MNESTFEQAIRDATDQPASIAIYADWLEEQGDPRCFFLRYNRFCPHCVPQRPIWESAMIWRNGDWICASHGLHWTGRTPAGALANLARLPATTGRLLGGPRLRSRLRGHQTSPKPLQTPKKALFGA